MPSTRTPCGIRVLARGEVRMSAASRLAEVVLLDDHSHCRVGQIEAEICIDLDSIDLARKIRDEATGVIADLEAKIRRRRRQVAILQNYRGIDA